RVRCISWGDQSLSGWASKRSCTLAQSSIVCRLRLRSNRAFTAASSASELGCVAFPGATRACPDGPPSAPAPWPNPALCADSGCAQTGLSPLQAVLRSSGALHFLGRPELVRMGLQALLHLGPIQHCVPTQVALKPGFHRCKQCFGARVLCICWGDQSCPGWASKRSCTLAQSSIVCRLRLRSNRAFTAASSAS